MGSPACGSPARATGRNLLEWPIGRFTRASRRAGSSRSPLRRASRRWPASLDAARAADPNHTRHEWGPFLPDAAAGAPADRRRRSTYTLRSRHASTSSDGQFATEKTHVSFEGRTAWGERAHRSGFT